MKISLELLTAALKPAADILRAKAAKDTPRYLKVEASSNSLRLSANDASQSVIMDVACDGELKPFCVPFLNLQNIMPLFGENVSMDLTDKTLKIRSKGSFSLNIVDVKEFVDIKTEKAPKIAVNCVDLADCIDAVKFASRVEDSRVNLFGVNVRLTAKAVLAEASTGHIFAKMEKASIAADCEFLIPFPFIANVVSNLRNPGAVLSVSESRISIAFDNGCYACSLFGVKFPQMIHQLEEKPKLIGEFKPADWLPTFRSVYSMAGEEGKLRTDVTIEDGRLKYQGPQGTVDTKIDKLSKPLRLNAGTFIGCLEAFGDNSCKAYTNASDAFLMRAGAGDLMVATTQLKN